MTDQNPTETALREYRRGFITLDELEATAPDLDLTAEWTALAERVAEDIERRAVSIAGEFGAPIEAARDLATDEEVRRAVGITSDPALATVRCTRCGQTEPAGLVSPAGECEECDAAIEVGDRETTDAIEATYPGEAERAEAEERVAREASIAIATSENAAVSVAAGIVRRAQSAIDRERAKLADSIEPETPEAEAALREIEALGMAIFWTEQELAEFTHWTLDTVRFAIRREADKAVRS